MAFLNRIISNKNREILLRPQTYGKHNSRSTLEQVFINPLKKDLSIWENEIIPVVGKGYNREVSDIKYILNHYESNKHLLTD